MNTDYPTGLGCNAGPFGALGGYGGSCVALCGYGGAPTPDGGACAPCAVNADCAPAGETCSTSTGACG